MGSEKEEGKQSRSGMRGRLKEKEWKIIIGYLPTYFFLNCYLPSNLGTLLASSAPAGCQQ